MEIREPERDKNFMVAFDCAEKGLCAAYNLAIEQILKKDDLSPFHQIGSRDEPGEHAWEVWTSMGKIELRQLLTRLLPEIESAAKMMLPPGRNGVTTTPFREK